MACARPASGSDPRAAPIRHQKSGGSDMSTAARLDAAEVKALFDKISNWGRWGKDDERGALNFITPAKRAQAGRLVQTGETASVPLPLSTKSGPDTPTPV